MARRPNSYIAMRWSHYYRDGRVKFLRFVPLDDDNKRVWPVFSGRLQRGDRSAPE